ncbi:MAG: hypothetical protein ABIU77_23120, partial [Ferruginibacter sp.]
MRSITPISIISSIQLYFYKNVQLVAKSFLGRCCVSRPTTEATQNEFVKHKLVLAAGLHVTPRLWESKHKSA